MSYVNFERKEDAQNESFLFLANCVFNAADAIRTRNAESLYTECNILYMTFKTRLDPEHCKTCKELRSKAAKILYGKLTVSPTELSRSFEVCMEWYETLCEYLSDKGLLMRLEANLDEIVARRSA